MRSEKEIEKRIRGYDYIASAPSINQLARAVAHEKAEVLRWVLEEPMIVVSKLSTEVET